MSNANYSRKNGLRAGYGEYRYGTKPKKLDAVYKGEARRHVVDLVMDALRDWRLSKFENEGPVRAGIRAARILCAKRKLQMVRCRNPGRYVSRRRELSFLFRCVRPIRPAIPRLQSASSFRRCIFCCVVSDQSGKERAESLSGVRKTVSTVQAGCAVLQPRMHIQSR